MKNHLIKTPRAPQTNICIDLGVFCKQVLKVGYSSDGGYWIQDLVRYGQRNKECSILKIATDVQNHGHRFLTASYQAFTSGDLKLSHHFDGRAQISGTGVISGYEPDGVPRGAAVQSFKLNETNDGGPVFTFMTWGCENLKRAGANDDLCLIPDGRFIHSEERDRRLNGIAIKGYYLLKEKLPKDFDFSKQLRCQSPIDGTLFLHLVQSPVTTPGVLGFLATFGWCGFTEPFGFTLSGAPGQVYDQRYCDGLSVIYPHTSGSEHGVDLNYKRTI